jgi:imidazolonepropionase
LKVYKNISQLVTLAGAHKKEGRNIFYEDLSIIDNGAIVFDDEKIIWIGSTPELPAKFEKIPTHDLSGHVLTPGLIDSHTHLVFAGNRANEYVDRLNGTDYQLIAKNGGGILHTVKETQSSTFESLLKASIKKVEQFISIGICSLEIKSGYALTKAGELKTLRVIAELKRHFEGKIKIFSTFLGAHAVPKDFTSSHDFINSVVIPTLIEGHHEKLIDFVDIFVEEGYFDNSDAQLLFKKAIELGIPLKIHADEFNDNQGGKLAAELNAVSADHLLKVSDESIKALAQSNTVATLLPGTAFFLGKPLAPARKILDAGCRVSIASDFNPGSSHINNVLLVASMAAPSLQMNLGEIWCGITLNAAHALNLSNQGYLAEGAVAQFSLFKCPQLSEITYNWGLNLSVKLP